MMSHLTLFFFLLISFSIVKVQAQSACPFKATDSTVTSLAAQTAGTIQGLQDSKNQCSAGFTEAVKSVHGLPDLIKASKNPTLELELQLRNVNKSIALNLSRTEGSTDLAASTQLDVLLSQKIQIESQLSLEKSRHKSNRIEESREKVISMTSNLLDAASTAMNDPNSPCAKNIRNNFGGNLLSIGTGALSAAGYLVSGAASGGITIIAGLLFKVMDFFNRMPSRVLKDYEQHNQTLDLACLYHGILNMTCDMKDNVKPSAKKRIIDEAKKIPHHPVYSAVEKAEDQRTDLANTVSSVVTMDTSSVVGNSSGSMDQMLLDTFAEVNKTTAKDKIEARIRKFKFLKDLYITTPNTYDRMTSTQKQIVTSYMDNFTREMAGSLEAEGMKVRSDNNTYLPMREIFIRFNANIEKILSAQLNEATGGSTGNYADLYSLHQGINIKNNLLAIQSTRDAYKAITNNLQVLNLSGTPDGQSLLGRIKDSEKMLSKFEEFLRVEHNDPNYREKLVSKSAEMKKPSALKKRIMSL